MATFDISKIDRDIQQLTQDLGIDLTKYGNASPIRLMIEALKLATKTLQDLQLNLHNEQNPLTATHFKSLLGLAAVQGMNPVTLLTASSGKVTIDPNGYGITVQNHSKLTSPDGYSYYLVIPGDAISISKPTEVLIKQGELKTQTESITGERWQTITLTADNYVDHESIQVTLNGRSLSVGKHLDEDADCYVNLDFQGRTIIVLSKNLEATVGETVMVEYADCVGIYGDNLEVDTIFTVKNFAYDGTTDVSKDISVYLSMPLIGGTDYDSLNTDLANEIRFSGKNNLVGTEEQLLQYVKRFKQYIVQTSVVTDGVLTLACYRNVVETVKNKNYWDAIQMISMTDDDIRSLVYHLNYMSNKSIELVVNCIPAKIGQCGAVVRLGNADNIDCNVIANAVRDYAIEELDTRNYEVGKLYRAVLSAYDISELYCELYPISDETLVRTTKFGTIEPVSIDTILVLSYLDIYIGDQLICQYGANG